MKTNRLAALCLIAFVCSTTRVGAQAPAREQPRSASMSFPFSAQYADYFFSSQAFQKCIVAKERKLPRNSLRIAAR